MNRMFPALSIVVLILLSSLPLARAQEEPAVQEPTVQAIEPGVQESFDRGLRLYRNRSFREAMSEFASVVASEPSRADAHYLTGYCHLMLKEFEQSVDAFRRAFEHDPEFDPRTIYQK